MKVLHIALTDGGGAGVGMLAQHRALLAQGVDSKVLVAIKRSDSDTVVQAKPNQYLWGSSALPLFLQKVARRFGICLNPYDKFRKQLRDIRKRHWTHFSCPITPYDLSTHPLVREADIINLHYVADFLDYSTFFQKVRKPMVWTVRDENPGLGGFHYTTTKEKFYSFYAPLEDRFVEMKKHALKDCRKLFPVALSEKMKDFLLNSECFAGREINVIPNAIESDSFKPADRKAARRKLRLSEEDYVISFVACDVEDNHKGFPVLTEAVRILQEMFLTPVKVVCVGMHKSKESDFPDFHFLGRLSGAEKLSEVYSASDVFVSPSRQESFGKTVVEALCCGTPVVSTSVGIAPEIIHSGNGVLCPVGDAKALAQALCEVSGRSFDRAAIRREACGSFQTKVVAEAYVHLYSEILRS